MLTCCAADTVTEQNLNRSVAFAQPCGVTSVLLSPAYLILLLCMAAGRCHSSVRADGAGGTNMICCSMTLQSERKRERRERETIWALKPAHPFHLPASAYATSEAYCMHRWPQAERQSALLACIYPQGDGFVLILVYVCRTVAPRKLRHPSATGSPRCSLEIANWFVRQCVVDPTGG